MDNQAILRRRRLAARAVVGSVANPLERLKNSLEISATRPISIKCGRLRADLIARVRTDSDTAVQRALVNLNAFAPV
jgi:hypothetical protein